MDVLVQGKRRRRMASPLLHHWQGDTAQNQVRMPQIVKTNPWEAGLLENAPEVTLGEVVRMERQTVRLRKYQPQVAVV